MKGPGNGRVNVTSLVFWVLCVLDSYPKGVGRGLLALNVKLI